MGRCKHCGNNFSIHPKCPTKKFCSTRCRGLQNSRLRAAKNRYDRTGFTPEIFEGKLSSQGGLCAICLVKLSDLSPKTVHADHCHKTGDTRGVLCANCNAILGHAKDNPLILERAIDYLSFYRFL